MKRNVILSLLAVLCVGALAYAAAPVTIDPIGRWVKGPLFVGTRGNGLATNAVTQSLAVSFDVNVGAVDGGCYYGGTTLTGARAGDACFASLTNPWPAGMSPTCFTGTDTVTVVVCSAFDPTDAGYAVRVFSAQ